MKPLVLALTAVLVLLVSAPRTADAKGIVIVNTGSDILYLHDVPQAALAEMPDLAGYKVGYKYSLFGVFWLDVWRWGGELVIYKDHEYEPIPEEQRELFGGDSTPIGYRLPPGLLLIVSCILFFIGMSVSRRVRIGITAAMGAATAAAYVAGIGISIILPAGATGLLLIACLSGDTSEPTEPSEPETSET